MSKKQKTIAFRRRRDGQTDYRKRLRLLVGNKPRAVCRKSGKYIWLQLVDYNKTGDRVSISAHSRELQKLGWQGCFNNIPAAYLTGLLFAKKAKEAKIKEVIIDNGLYATVAKSAFFAVLKGMIDGGLPLPIASEVMPSDDRIKGEHIKNYAEKLKKEGGFEKQFSYDALKIPEIFEQTKQKIV